MRDEGRATDVRQDSSSRSHRIHDIGADGGRVSLAAGIEQLCVHSDERMGQASRAFGLPSGARHADCMATSQSLMWRRCESVTQRPRFRAASGQLM